VTKRVFISVRRCVLSCIGGEWVKILFKLSPNVWYYRRTFSVLLHSGLELQVKRLVNTQWIKFWSTNVVVACQTSHCGQVRMFVSPLLDVLPESLICVFRANFKA
jgi:hypothetical protein